MNKNHSINNHSIKNYESFVVFTLKAFKIETNPQEARLRQIYDNYSVFELLLYQVCLPKLLENLFKI